MHGSKNGQVVGRERMSKEREERGGKQVEWKETQLRIIKESWESRREWKKRRK